MDSFENISDCSNYISSTIMYRVVSKLSTNKITSISYRSMYIIYYNYSKLTLFFFQRVNIQLRRQQSV